MVQSLANQEKVTQALTWSPPPLCLLTKKKKKSNNQTHMYDVCVHACMYMCMYAHMYAHTVGIYRYRRNDRGQDHLTSQIELSSCYIMVLFRQRRGSPHPTAGHRVPMYGYMLSLFPRSCTPDGTLLFHDSGHSLCSPDCLLP